MSEDKKTSILLVEDDPMVRRYAHAQLVKLGYQVLEAPDGEVTRIIRDLPELMTSVASLRVPLKVDVGSGPNWERAH